MRIVLTGGGTGGHLIPFEPIIESLRTVYLEQQTTLAPKLDPSECKLYFLGVADEATHVWFARFDVESRHIPSGKLRRYFSPLTLVDLVFKLPFGIIKALIVMWQVMPEVVISKGGYGSLPVLLAARFYRIPILLHESDAVSGLANRLTARWAACLAVGFAATKNEMTKYQHKTFVTGTPIRTRFGQQTPAEAKIALGFTPTDSLVLVMGGSQGAEQLNEILLQVLPQLILETGILHITGTTHYTKIITVASELLESSSRKDFYKPFPYLEETVITAMTAADVVVSRAGATTLAELTHLRKPMLLIPLPSAANDHQRRNAQEYEKLGAARVLDPINLGRNLFSRSLEDLLRNADMRADLAKNLAQLDHPRAARDITELAFKLAQGLVPAAPPVS